MSKISREEYYEEAFQRLEKENKHTWNWAAFCFSITWMLYRKMHLYSLIWLVCFAIVRTLNIDLYFDILTMGLLGYYGNYLYYRTVKKKILKGYHLLDNYAPTSVPSSIFLCLSSGIICLADYISKKMQLKGHINQSTNVDAESIRSYLKPDKKNHWVVKIANTFICLLLLLMVLVPAIKIIGSRIKTQLKQEQTVTTTVSNIDSVFKI